MITFFINKIMFSTDSIINQVVKVDNYGKSWIVPEDEANSDYKEYLAWLAQGNTPEELNNG